MNVALSNNLYHCSNYIFRGDSSGSELIDFLLFVISRLAISYYGFFCFSNGAGRLTATSDNGRSLSYTYDAAGNRTKVGWPNGYSANYAYDALNRVNTIKENNLATLATYAYDTAGRRASITLGNGTVTSDCLRGLPREIVHEVPAQYDDNALKTLSHNVNAADDVNGTSPNT